MSDSTKEFLQKWIDSIDIKKVLKEIWELQNEKLNPPFLYYFDKLEPLTDEQFQKIKERNEKNKINPINYSRMLLP